MYYSRWRFECLVKSCDKLRVLFSARDLGAAEVIAEVIKSANNDSRFEVFVVAEGKALEWFLQNGLAAQGFLSQPIESSSDRERDGLLAEAEQVLKCIMPDAIISGMSGPTIGVDEALIASAGSIATYVIQDYAGWVVNGFECHAETYFVGDVEAKKITDSRYDVRTIVSGSPRYQKYSKLTPFIMRTDARHSLLKDNATTLIGFYGQSAWDIDGYWQTIDDLAEELCESELDLAIMYRPHPAESTIEREKILSRFRETGRLVILDPHDSVEMSLSVVDIVTTCFSSCGECQINLSRASSAPLGSVIYLMHHESLRDYHLVNTGVTMPLMATAGIGLVTLQRDDLRKAIKKASSLEFKNFAWELGRHVLPDHEKSVDTILSTVANDFFIRPENDVY